MKTMTDSNPEQHSAFSNKIKCAPHSECSPSVSPLHSWENSRDQKQNHRQEAEHILKESFVRQMTVIQSHLHENIEDLQTEVGRLKSEINTLKEKSQRDDFLITNLKMLCKTKGEDCSQQEAKQNALKDQIEFLKQENSRLVSSLATDRKQKDSKGRPKSNRISKQCKQKIQLVDSLLEIFETNDIEELQNRLKQTCRVGEHKLVHNIRNMLCGIMPDTRDFSEQDIWKWLRGTLEAFMKLRQSTEGRLIHSLEDLLNVPSSRLYTRINELLTK